LVTCRELVEKLRNVHAVNVTPFRDDRSIDYEGLEENIQFLLEDGVEEAAAVTRFVTERSTAGQWCWPASDTT
jgi:hypothetical protein